MLTSKCMIMIVCVPADGCDRDFIKENYKQLKAFNPGLPIYMRPSEGAQPHIAARYGKVETCNLLFQNLAP